MAHQFGHEMGGFGGMTGWPSFGNWTGTQTPVGTSGHGMGFGGEQMGQTPWTGGQGGWTGMGGEMTQPWQQTGGFNWHPFWQFHQMMEQHPPMHMMMHRMLGSWFSQTPMEHFFPQMGGMFGGTGMFGQQPLQQFTGFGSGFGGGFGMGHQFPWHQFFGGTGHQFPWHMMSGFGGFGGFPWQGMGFGGFGQMPWMNMGNFGGFGGFGGFPWHQMTGFGQTPWQGMGFGGFGTGHQPFFGGMGHHSGSGFGTGMGRMWQTPWQGMGGFGGGFRMTDDQITDVVNDWMDCFTMFGGETDVRCESRDGVVTLTGTVHNKWFKHHLDEFCWTLPGVQDVQNQIRVTNRRQEQGRGTQTGRTNQTPQTAGTGAKGS